MVFAAWLAHQNAIFDVAWITGEKQLLTASGDQTVALWDGVEEAQLLTFKGHTSSVKSLAVRPEHTRKFRGEKFFFYIWRISCLYIEKSKPPVSMITGGKCFRSEISINDTLYSLQVYLRPVPVMVIFFYGTHAVPLEVKIKKKYKKIQKSKR